MIPSDSDRENDTIALLLVGGFVGGVVLGAAVTWLLMSL